MLGEGFSAYMYSLVMLILGHSMAFQPKVGRYVLDFGPTSHIYVS